MKKISGDELMTKMNHADTKLESAMQSDFGVVLNHNEPVQRMTMNLIRF